MPQSMWKVLAPLFLSICLPVSSSAQSASPEAIVGDFVKAWNSHDMKALDRLLTDDAIWVPVAEVIDEGRGNIVKDFGAPQPHRPQFTPLAPPEVPKFQT